MAEELKVVLNRGDCGLGFSILGTSGLPPIIYDIVENSPAAESGEVEAGDVILKVNETDVNCFSTKEVLKCLRLSAEPITLKLKRDPVIKARVQTYLASHDFLAEELTEFVVSRDRAPPVVPPLPPPPPPSTTRSNGSHASNVDSFAEEDRLAWEPLGSSDKFQRSRPTPRFEAFMMTGDLILNLSRTQQGTGLLPKQQKKVDSLRCHQKQTTHHNSVPSSPNESAQRTAALTSDSSSSAGTSPVGKHAAPMGVAGGGVAGGGGACEAAAGAFGYHGNVRTSRSEDHLQFQKDSLSAVDIDIDDDVTSSLHTLLDTRQDDDGSDSADRIVWTYNAPAPAGVAGAAGAGDSSSSASSSMSSSSSPRRSLSPPSPTSVSSSVMSSNEVPLLGSDSNSQRLGERGNAELLSQSEGVSNISSPDFQEEETLDILSGRDLMEVSDPSDSDSTLLVSDRQPERGNNGAEEHRIVIQVKGPDGRRGSRSSGEPGTPELCGYQELRDCEEEPRRDVDPSSPPMSEEDSDLESLHSFHFSPKAVDVPSAVRLAKRLFALDGFKKSDVSRHLSKNNEFSRTVADEYLRYFDLERDTLDAALRKFLKQFSLAGETQERERVLVHFSKRYLDCNPRSFNSQDAVHTLTCAIMLLNTDLHGQNIGRKMSCAEFVENLSELNDGENFPRDVLKLLYQAIKSHPLEWALDEEGDECTSALAGGKAAGAGGQQEAPAHGNNPFLDLPNAAAAVEYKKGYVMRKCCIDANGKKTVFGKRGWKMFYCTLRDMVLYLHKDEHGFRKSALADSVHNTIRVHHGLASKAGDYNKKQHVFRLQTCTRAEYLFQTSDSKELQSWIDTINLVCASFSAAPLEGAVGSQRRFQPPLLPCSHSKLDLREQLRDHEDRVARMEAELDDHRRRPPERGSKALALQNHREKDAYLHLELKRYKTYIYLLRSRVAQFPDAAELSDSPSPPPMPQETSAAQLVPPPVPDRRNNAATTTPPATVSNRKMIIYGED